jgi:hypothetical protein
MGFVIENAKNIAPRDLLPYMYDLDARMLPNAERDKLLEKLYKSYGGQSVDNPMAEFTAATDLFSLADTYANPSSKLSDNIKTKIKELSTLGEQARPTVVIDAPYYDDKWYNWNSKNAIDMMARRWNPDKRRIEPYLSIPDITELNRESRTQGKNIIDAVKNVFSDPANKGEFYTGSHSLSTDSYPLTLSLLARNKDLVDFVPVHEGAPFKIGTETNSLGGLSNYAINRRQYLNEIKPIFDNRFGNIPIPQQSRYSTPRSTAATKQLQNQLLESALLNHHIDAFNKKIGTNMPSAYYSGYHNDVQRPNVGAVVKKDGGPVKDDMGYWNPENWGKPVEINSNEITMQGVDQDLIGVSDAGDVKHMKANSPNNYKFKGKKVTEYPVKKNGGWLDKYN